jgi:hypothetical protein
MFTMELNCFQSFTNSFLQYRGKGSRFLHLLPSCYIVSYMELARAMGLVGFLHKERGVGGYHQNYDFARRARRRSPLQIGD